MSVIGTPVGSEGAEFSYDPLRGEQFTEHFTGSWEALLGRAMGLRVARPYLSFTLSPSDPPLWSLTVRSPEFSETQQQPGDVVTTWELLGNDIQKDLWESNLANGISNADETKIRKALANKDKLPTDPAETFSSISALKLWYLLKKGTTHLIVSQYVLRGTKILTTNTAVHVNFDYVNRIFSTAQLLDFNISGEKFSTTFAFTLNAILMPVPPNPVYTGSPGVLTPQTLSIYFPGWLKKTPTLHQIAGNRIQAQQEFWLESWSVDLYPPVV